MDITYLEIKRRVGLALNGIKADPDYDRIELVLCGIQVRAWRTRINCTTRYHLGYKSPWERRYFRTTYSRLVEMLVKRTGAHQEVTRSGETLGDLLAAELIEVGAA